jgi:multidrug efflux system membrane fusion protein
MAVRSSILAAAVVVAAVAYGAYAPDQVEKLAPPVGSAAHRLHDWAFGAPKVDSAQGPAPAQAPPGPQPVMVAVATVRRGDFPITLEGLGQAQAYNSVTVRARVDGQILKIGFEEGQDVKAGQMIAEIDPRPFTAALDAAKAKKQQDDANLANAKLDQARYASLAKQSYATQQQLDTQNSLVNQLVATVAADDAAIEAAQTQLDYATILAPIPGRAGLRLVDQGNMVSAAQQTGIVTIAQLEPIAAIFTAPETRIGAINAALAAGAPAVTVKNGDGKTLATGKLVVVDNQVDPSTATVRLKAEFANKDHALWPGLALTTSLTIGVDKDALIVPAVAIQHGQKGLYAYVVDDANHAQLRNVEVTEQTVDEAVVSSGLKEGERVVTTGLFLMQPGALVQIDSTAKGS